MHTHHHSHHISQQPKIQQSHKYLITQRTSLRNDTPQSNSSYPGSIQNKQMSHPTLNKIDEDKHSSPLFPPLQNRTIHDNTLIQLHQNKHTAQGHGFVDVGSLLDELRGTPSACCVMLLFCHRYSGVKSVGCALQVKRCLTSFGETPV